MDFYLRERDWGEMDVMSQEDRHKGYEEDLKRRKINNFFWTPPGGESMAHVCLRIDRILHTLHRECTDMRVIIVCHGDLMWGFRVRLERITQSRYKILDESKDPRDKLQNCQILHFTRRDPISGKLFPFCGWMRSICPWDESLSRNIWEKIERKRFTNSDLLAEVGKYPRLVNE